MITEDILRNDYESVRFANPELGLRPYDELSAAEKAMHREVHEEAVNSYPGLREAVRSGTAPEMAF